MLKKQLKAMEWVAHHDRYGQVRQFDHIHYTNEWIYVTDGFQLYRLPNESDEVTTTYPGYPVKTLDGFLAQAEDPEWTPIEFRIHSDAEVKHVPGKSVTRIGNDYYCTRYLKKAMDIMPQGFTAQANMHKRFRGLFLYHMETGSLAYILPIRLFDNQQ